MSDWLITDLQKDVPDGVHLPRVIKAVGMYLAKLMSAWNRILLYCILWWCPESIVNISTSMLHLRAVYFSITSVYTMPNECRFT